MTFLNVIGIAVALAMDAFAVAMATGVKLKKVNARQFFRLSWHFGFFQAMMPVIGWGVGLSVYGYIKQYDHWVAFGLLLFVGGKMIQEAFSNHEKKEEQTDPTKGSSLVLLSVATSIDALAVGLSLSLIGLSIFMPAGVIGIVAALFTSVGLYLGSKVVNIARLGKYAEIIGGIVLIAIALNILYSHGALNVMDGH